MSVIIDIASCFYFPNPSTGDTVKKLPLEDYVKLIGSKTCSLITQTNVQFNAISSISARVLKLENTPAPTLTLPYLNPTGIANPQIPLIITEFVALLEDQFVKERNAIGYPKDIYDAINIIANMNDAPALGTTGGKLSSLTGWTQTIADLSDGFTNLAVIVLDLRSAVANLKYMLPNICERIAITMQTVYENGILNFVFTGSVPIGLVNTVSGGATFKIEDYSGNHVNQTIDVLSYLNNVAGYSVNLNTTSINLIDDLKVTSIYTLTEPVSGTVCQKSFSNFVSNTIDCLSVTLSPTTTTIPYSFNHPGGTMTYNIELYSAANVLLQSRTATVTAAAVVSGTFSSLTAGTSYKVRLQMTSNGITRNCPFSDVSTIPNPCPAPLGATAILNT